MEPPAENATMVSVHSHITHRDYAVPEEETVITPHLWGDGRYLKSDTITIVNVEGQEFTIPKLGTLDPSCLRCWPQLHGDTLRDVNRPRYWLRRRNRLSQS